MFASCCYRNGRIYAVQNRRRQTRVHGRVTAVSRPRSVADRVGRCALCWKQRLAEGDEGGSIHPLAQEAHVVALLLSFCSSQSELAEGRAIYCVGICSWESSHLLLLEARNSVLLENP